MNINLSQSSLSSHVELIGLKFKMETDLLADSNTVRKECNSCHIFSDFDLPDPVLKGKFKRGSRVHAFWLALLGH